MQKMKDSIAIYLMGILLISIFALSLRGLPGNPSMSELNTLAWKNNGPFESSPERGRFALLYSFIEDGSLHFSLDVAKFALPDLAISSSGEYVSLFAPGISFLVMPGYVAGKFFGAAQVGVFAVVVCFAILNFLLIRAISLHIGARRWSATLGALTFLFATPAFAYGVNLYQHHISVFLLLLSVFLLLKYSGYWSLAVVWFSCAVSVAIDNPNIFLMTPVAMYSLLQAWKLFRTALSRRSIGVFFGKILLAVTTTVPVILLFLLYNFLAYGSAFQLPGTLPSISVIDHDGRPIVEPVSGSMLSENTLNSSESNNEKTAIGFFETRNLYNGFYEHFLSADRGILFFSPVIVLGIFGFFVLYKTRPEIVSFLTAIMGMNILLYSMWGDPYGGWAFGSRYLIPTYAVLAIGMSVGLSQSWKKHALFFMLFIPLFLYSAWVNTLGAITSSANPPKAQVLFLEKQSGHEEKYTFMRNWEFLQGRYESVQSKAFVYQAFLKDTVNASQYFAFVYELIVLSAALCFAGMYREKQFSRIFPHNKD